MTTVRTTAIQQLRDALDAVEGTPLEHLVVKAAIRSIAQVTTFVAADYMDRDVLRVLDALGISGGTRTHV